eukprot:12162214-Alexandrium_andersonii.AAC.1
MCIRDRGEHVASSGRNSGHSRVARSPVASVPVAAPVATTKAIGSRTYSVISPFGQNWPGSENPARELA